MNERKRLLRSWIKSVFPVLICFSSLALNIKLASAQAESLDVNQTAAPARLRVERTPVAGGAELLTIWARVVGSETPTEAKSEPDRKDQREELPLVTVLRDTLGDEIKENDVLRQVWVHTYAQPTLLQKAAALVPFLYKGVRAKPSTSMESSPRAIINLADTSQPVWRQLLVSGIIKAVVDQPLSASIHNYQRNITDYRKSNVIRALTVLSLYEAERKSDATFTASELIEMKSRFALTDKMFGGLVDKTRLSRFNEQDTSKRFDNRAHNWELLRQQAEATGLFFEPLMLSNNYATHALLWIPADQLSSEHSFIDRRYDDRFLNIKNPWRDERLLRWRGYTETKYFNLANRLVPASDAEARPVTMIPLALYGLDFEKIPALLIDFRDTANARRRELSRRVINDVARDVFSISRLGNVYYFLGRSTFDFITSRRGIDVNQPSRLRSAVELRLLLSFNSQISAGLSQQLSKGLEDLTVNPLESGIETERRLALAHYQSLRVYALRPDGLPAKLERERSSELTKYIHRGLEGKLLRFVKIVTPDRYMHREKMTPELFRLLDKERQVAYHTNFLRHVVKSTPLVEVTWNLEAILPSLRFLAENGSIEHKDAAKVVGLIFRQTQDSLTRDLCLSALKRIGNEVARREMLRIYDDNSVALAWRITLADYLRIAPPHDSKATENEISGRVSN
jgi:hypothetical protein